MMLFLERWSAVLKQEAEHPQQSELSELTAAFDICLNYYKRGRERERGEKNEVKWSSQFSVFPLMTPTQPPSLQAPKAKQHLTNLLLVRINMPNGRHLLSPHLLRQGSPAMPGSQPPELSQPRF